VSDDVFVVGCFNSTVALRMGDSQIALLDPKRVFRYQDFLNLSCIIFLLP
jgi:hypothetical protein